VSIQRKLAAKILKCGSEKVWIDPKNEKVKQAITRRDVRRFIKEGIIKKIPDKKAKIKEEKSQQKAGSRKGSRLSRLGKKTDWLKVVRPQRRLLRELREKNQLKTFAYRKIYKMIKGNAFRNKSHLMSYLKDKELLEEEKK
jgi:large subunit ribosomal protein L19e